MPGPLPARVRGGGAKYARRQQAAKRRGRRAKRK